MGCGHSKINLYPKRSKHKGRSKKTAQAADKDDSEEEEESPEDPAVEEPEPEEVETPNTTQDVLPIAEHTPAFEVSVSQQNFFKMLDEKIEQGKDYDSSSETEIREEHERRLKLLEHWHAHSLSTQSSLSQSGPPTPANKSRLTRSVSKISERQCAPGSSKQCYWQSADTPTRRCHGGQTHDGRPCTSEQVCKSPVKRTQSAGSTWRNNPKVAPMPKPKSDKKDEAVAVAGCSKDSQITYNPTFQNHSPAHSSKSQPLRAQIVSHPLTQQVPPPSPSKFITPPEEYQDAEDNATGGQMTVTLVNSQSQIYYIHGNNNTAASVSPDIVQQRQQTAIHLQQYVAMKQAQQQVFTSYVQSGAHAVFPSAEYPPNPHRLYEGEELAAQYGYPGFRPQSAPHRSGFAVTDVTHMHAPMMSPLPPIMTTPWAGGQVPPEMQYYPQSQFVPMFRANSAGSAGTLTRYAKKEDGDKSVQSINVVRGKPVGQIVSAGQELVVTSTQSDSPSPASVSTDSGVSPGTSAPSSKSSFSTTPPTTRANETFETKPKKNKSGTNRALKLSKSLDG